MSYVTVGQSHSVHKDDIEDWMMIESGRLLGGYSVSVLTRRGAQ